MCHGSRISFHAQRSFALYLCPLFLSQLAAVILILLVNKVVYQRQWIADSEGVAEGGPKRPDNHKTRTAQNQQNGTLSTKTERKIYKTHTLTEWQR